jgi:hypothetical protein
MNLPKAFFTSRVTEALASLAVHVTSARNIAASLKPIKTAALDLEDEEQPRPIITSINPARIPDRSHGTVEFKLKGKNFTQKSVTGFALFFEDDPKVIFTAKSVTPDQIMVGRMTKTIGFKASVDLGEAPPGSYEVRVVDENEMRHLPGFTIEIEADEDSEETSDSLGMPPTITTPPEFPTVNLNDQVNLKVVATGTEPLSYQWLKDGKVIAGKTDNRFEIRSAKTGDQGNYSVVVANTAGFVVSTVAELIVRAGTHSKRN